MNESSFYHYTECGLDNVYLSNGFKTKLIHGEEHIAIQDIDGLHNVIGLNLVESHKRLNGKELRFLRNEMLCSQDSLAKILGVDPQTVARWEKEQFPIHLATEATIRLMYKEFIGKDSKVSEMLKRLADLEDAIQSKLVLEDTDGIWSVAA